MSEVILGVPPSVLRLLNEELIKRPFLLPRVNCWRVYEERRGDTRRERAHFVDGRHRSLCRLKAARGAPPGRAWRVERDAGRIPLCERCKAKLRETP